MIKKKEKRKKSNRQQYYLINIAFFLDYKFLYRLIVRFTAFLFLKRNRPLSLSHPRAVGASWISWKHKVLKNAHRAVISRSFSTHKTLKRVRLRATAWGISSTLGHEFSVLADTKEGICGGTEPYVRPRRFYFPRLILAKTHAQKTHMFAHKYSRPTCVLCAPAFYDKSALLPSAKVQWRVSHLLECERVAGCKVVGGKSFTFDVSLVHSWQSG